MGVNILEYWRGLEKNRHIIGMGPFYKTLDPEAFYIGANCDVDGDQVEPEDLNEGEKRRVLTYDSPWDAPVERELYIGECCGILIEYI